MSVLALPNTPFRAFRRFADGARQLFASLSEGLAAAHRYERLSGMNDAQLARLGIKREDLAWYAFSGERRPG